MHLIKEKALQSRQQDFEFIPFVFNNPKLVADAEPVCRKIVEWFRHLVGRTDRRPSTRRFSVWDWAAKRTGSVLPAFRNTSLARMVDRQRDGLPRRCLFIAFDGYLI